MTPAEFDKWYCTPYISAIALQISEELKGTDVRVIRRVAEGEGNILTRVRTLLWLVTFCGVAGCGAGGGRFGGGFGDRAAHGNRIDEGAGSRIQALVGVLLAAEQLLLAFVGGGIGYAVGIVAGASAGREDFRIRAGAEAVRSVASFLRWPR